MNLGKPMRPEPGFTLIELMIVVAIVAIITAIALPAYNDQVERGRRADGKVVLMDLASRQERFYTQNVSYATSITAATELNLDSNTSPDGHYTVALTVTPNGCSAADNTGNCTYFELVATTTMGDTKCITLTYDSRGVKGHTGSAPDVETCWR